MVKIIVASGEVRCYTYNMRLTHNERELSMKAMLIHRVKFDNESAATCPQCNHYNALLWDHKHDTHDVYKCRDCHVLVIDREETPMNELTQVK